MKTDHKAAKEWAAILGARLDSSTTPNANLAAAYLELRELAKAVAHSQMDEESRWPEMRALRAAIGKE